MEIDFGIKTKARLYTGESGLTTESRASDAMSDLLNEVSGTQMTKIRLQPGLE